jgi:hypothetical protein
MELPDINEPPDFSGWFNYESLYDREQELRKDFTVPGWTALKVGELAQKIPYIIVTLPCNKDFIEKAGMFPVTTMEEALALAEKKLGRKDYTIMLMPNGANTVPFLKKA